MFDVFLLRHTRSFQTRTRIPFSLTADWTSLTPNVERGTRHTDTRECIMRHNHTRVIMYTRYVYSYKVRGILLRSSCKHVQGTCDLVQNKTQDNPVGRFSKLFFSRQHMEQGDDAPMHEKISTKSFQRPDFGCVCPRCSGENRLQNWPRGCGMLSVLPGTSHADLIVMMVMSHRIFTATRYHLSFYYSLLTPAAPERQPTQYSRRSAIYILQYTNYIYIRTAVLVSS